MIKEKDGIYKLYNGRLSAVVMPDRGGKIASIYYPAKDFELLFQNPSGNWGRADLSSAFEDYEAAGFDDTFPSIDPGIVKVNGKDISYPDHGEIWTSRMEASAGEDEIRLSTDSRILDYRYQKTIRLDDSSIIISYRIENTGGHAFPAIWTMHALTAIDDDTEIFIPDGISSIQNAFGEDGILPWEKDGRLPYPITGDYDFRKALNKDDAGKCLKFYVPDAVTEGRCGYIYPSRGLRAVISYDPSKIPYLGFWKTIGGFRGDINIALEPSTGFYDSIANAAANGRCPIFNPGDILTFDIRIAIEEM